MATACGGRKPLRLLDADHERNNNHQCLHGPISEGATSSRNKGAQSSRNEGAASSELALPSPPYSPNR